MVKLRLKKKYAILSLVLAALGLFSLVLGGSYAFFTHQVTSKDYVIYTGNLQIDYTKTGNLINLTKAYPKTNTEGLSQEGYSFNITNNGSVDARYQIRLELDSNNTLPLEYIKMAYIRTRSNGEAVDEEIEPVLLSNLNNTLTFITNKQIETGKTDSYILKLWIDYNAPNDIEGKTFKASIVVDSLQDVEDRYVMADTRPIITLNKYSDGNIDKIINVGETFTDPGVLSVKDDKDLLTEQDVTVTGTVNTNQVGVYHITYSVTDSANNTTEVERIVAVGNEESLNIKHNVSGVLSMYTQEEQADNEAIFCSVIHGTDDMYLGCSIHNTVEDAFSKHIRGIVIMTSDSITNTINIEQQNFIFNLNNHKINSNSMVFYLKKGSLKITGNGMISTTEADTGNGAIKMFGDGGGELIIDGNQCDSTDPTQYSSGLLIYSEDNSAIANYGDYYNDNNPASLELNGGCYVSKNYAVVGNNGIANLTINNGIFEGMNNIVQNQSNGIININGGKFIASSGIGINNKYTGTININQDELPIYISSYDNEYNDATIKNSSNGRINIKANQANTCNATASNTTSGLCVYANGDTANYAGMSVRNRTGIININGGTYNANYMNILSDNGQMFIQNANIIAGMHGIAMFKGTTNIKNSTINSNTSAISFANGNSNPTVNLCSTTIISASSDFRFYSAEADTTPTINYSTDVIFKNGTNNPSYSGTGTVNITSNACNWQ